MVHNVSYDLKAPLRAIANLSQWIEDDLESKLPPSNQKQFQLLRTRVKRMESMIGSLLLYARAGRQTAPLETFDLAELLNLSSMRLCLIIKPSLKLYLSNKYQLLKWKNFHFIINN